MAGEYECTLVRRGAVAVIASRGAMCGDDAFDLYLTTIDRALDDPEVRALVSDLRAVTRRPTVRDCIRFAQRASANPRGEQITRSVVVTASAHPVLIGLMRVVANASRFFPERRIIVGDVEAAIAWASEARPYVPPSTLGSG